MKVVFLKDVQGVANGGDVKEVKNGFARNYLIPQNLATPATKDSLRRIEKLGKQADEQRLKTLADMKDLAEQVDGAKLSVEMRAGASGRLYGSVTNTIVADKISDLTDRNIDRRTITIPEPIRTVGKHELNVRLYPGVTASIDLTVHPTGTDPEEFIAQLSNQPDDSEEEVLVADETAVSELESPTVDPQVTDASGSNESSDDSAEDQSSK